MKDGTGKVVLISGASSGIGKYAANYLCDNNYKVYGTSRRINGPARIRTNGNGFINMLRMDVCSDESVSDAVNQVIEREGKIDILINCAGYALAGAVEDTTVDDAYNQFNTNCFGIIRTCSKVVPIMRTNGGGTIINISSVAGLVTVPYQSMYSASKYAVEAVTEGLRMEVKQFNIKVSMIEPGDLNTGFTDNRQFVAASGESSAYRNKFVKSVNEMIKSEKSSPTPEKVIQAIARIIDSNNPPIRVTVGLSYKAVAILKRVLPSRLTEFIVSKLY